MHESLKRLIGLQRIYTEREETRAALTGIPAQRATNDAVLHEFQDSLKALSERVATTRKTVRSLETDIDVLKDARTKYESQLLAAKTNEVYKALLAEIEGVKRKVLDVEEKILDFMTEEEEIRRKAEAKKKEEPAAKSRCEARHQELAAEESRLRALAAELDAAWERETGAAEPHHLDIFMRLVKGRQGVAVSRLSGEDCEACAMLVRPHLVQQVKAGENIFLCESCSRILYWEEDAGEAVPDA